MRLMTFESKGGGTAIHGRNLPALLFFDAEHIHDGETFYKCAPPIREKSNQMKLWQAVKDERLILLFQTIRRVLLR